MAAVVEEVAAAEAVFPAVAVAEAEGVFLAVEAEVARPAVVPVLPAAVAAELRLAEGELLRSVSPAVRAAEQAQEHLARARDPEQAQEHLARARDPEQAQERQAPACDPE